MEQTLTEKEGIHTPVLWQPVSCVAGQGAERLLTRLAVFGKNSVRICVTSSANLTWYKNRGNLPHY